MAKRIFAEAVLIWLPFSLPRPHQPRMVSKGVEVNKLVPGGLLLTSEFKSEMIGVPFEGR